MTSGADVVGTDAAAKVGVGASIGANIGVNTTVAEVADKAVLTGGKGSRAECQRPTIR